MKLRYATLTILLSAILTSNDVHAAAGCTLTDPDRDIVRIFPEATGYRTDFITIEEQGGMDLFKTIEDRLGDSLDPVYEAPDVPYAFYTVLKDKEPIARVHGVNQKSVFGGMQLILATDLDGTVVDFYFQKISSPEAKLFRSDSFTDQFVGHTLQSYLESESELKDPTVKSSEDFHAIRRGIRKNLILLDVFHMNNDQGE